MAIYTDTNCYVVYGKETVYGTPPTNVDIFIGIPINSSLNMMNNLNSEYGIGYGRNVQGIWASLFDVSSTLTYKLTNGAFFEFMLGSKSGSGTTNDPYVYNISSLPSFTLEYGFDLSSDQAVRMLGCYVKSASIKCNVEETVNVDLNIVAKTASKSNTYQTLTAPSDELFYFTEGVVEINSTPVAEITGIVVNIDNGIQKASEIGSRTSTQYAGNVSITGTLNMRLNDANYIEWLFGSTGGPTSTTPSPKTDIKLKLTKGSKHIYITLTDVYSNDYKINLATKQLVTEQIGFSAKNISISEVV
ncbi:MAG: phage tail tube protein [Candidatus Aenigmatarchaeota archaeon]